MMQGFFRYRHLLLRKSGDNTYLLGVPGEEDAQTGYLAQAFGFPEFRQTQDGERAENFGYWCRTVKIADEKFGAD